MRTQRYPKPERKPRGIPSRIAVRMANPFGDHREKVKYANELWRRLVYAKEPTGLCPACRKRKWHDAAHCFIKGVHFVVRFDLDNGSPLCRVCHRRIDADHVAKEEFFRRYIGDEAYDKLRMRTLGRGKIDMGLVILLLEQETERAKTRLGYWPVGAIR